MLVGKEGFHIRVNFFQHFHNVVYAEDFVNKIEGSRTHLCRKQFGKNTCNPVDMNKGTSLFSVSLYGDSPMEIGVEHKLVNDSIESHALAVTINVSAAD